MRIALAVALLVGLAACGSTDHGSSPNGAKQIGAKSSHHVASRTRPGGNTNKGE